MEKEDVSVTSSRQPFQAKKAENSLRCSETSKNVR